MEHWKQRNESISVPLLLDVALTLHDRNHGDEHRLPCKHTTSGDDYRAAATAAVVAVAVVALVRRYAGVR